MMKTFKVRRIYGVRVWVVQVAQESAITVRPLARCLHLHLSQPQAIRCLQRLATMSPAQRAEYLQPAPRRSV